MAHMASEQILISSGHFFTLSNINHENDNNIYNILSYFILRDTNAGFLP